MEFVILILLFLCVILFLVLKKNREKANKKIFELEQRVNELSKYQEIIDIEVKTKEIIEEAQKIKNKFLLEANEAKEIRKSIITNANDEAQKIINDANKKAEEIAGEAYKALENKKELERTVKALKNKIEGYGDEYLLSAYSLLDDLAENYSYTEAGEELKKARDKTNYMIKNGLAGKCDYVEANRKDIAINFVVDAFNGKVDSILTNIKENNYGILKQKIIDAYDLVNSNGKSFRNAVITQEYLQARLNELKWGVIAIELRNKDKEEQRKIKEQLREEEKARKEYEKALKDAEKQEEAIKKAIEKAHKEMLLANEQQKSKYEQQLKDLEIKLKEAEEKNQRAKSMAELTKSGHVYIISNVGSFGENIYKIGMTRRLEPTDRIRELGDASVPFEFDVHALIYSKDAPKLENELHKTFMKNQLNKVNPRKEFFKVNLTDIKESIERLGIKAQWTMTAEATEYRESLAIEKEIMNDINKQNEWIKYQVKTEEKILEIED